VAAARYTEGGQLDIVVQGILGRIARAHGYRADGARWAPASQANTAVIFRPVRACAREAHIPRDQ